MPLLGPSCKSRLFRFSAKLKSQDWPSVAIKPSECLTSISSSNISPAFIIGPAAASKYSSHSRILYTTCCFVILIISIFQSHSSISKQECALFISLIKNEQYNVYSSPTVHLSTTLTQLTCLQCKTVHLYFLQPLNRFTSIRGGPFLLRRSGMKMLIKL